MPNRRFLRDDLRLEESGCYSWCGCGGRCIAASGQADRTRFNPYCGDDVLELLNEFVRDMPVPEMAFDLGELIVASITGSSWTKAQALEWLRLRWMHSASAE